MQTLKNTRKTVGDLAISIDEKLDKRFGDSPLFPEKIAKATRIMTIVREKQQEANKR